MNRVAQYCSFLTLAFAGLLTMSDRLRASDGDLDLTFGTGGRTIAALPGFARALALQPDGKIVVAGSTVSYPGNDFAVARYNSDGSLDTTFGNQGTITTDFGATDEAFAVAFQPDGKIVVAGETRSTPSQIEKMNFFSWLALTRYNSDGSLDSTFGMDGKIVTDFPGVNDHPSLAVQPDGKIVVAGGTYDPSDPARRSNFALARLNKDGSLDASFGNEGKIITDFSGRGGMAFALALYSDGKIVAAGLSEAITASGTVVGGLALARYNSDGSPDPAFGIGGQVVTDPNGINSTVYAVALQPDGKIVVAGGGVVLEIGLRLLRYQSDGSLDTTFSNAGTAAVTAPDAWSVALQSDGKIVIGTIPGVGTVSVARYNSDGSLDTSFASGGYAGNGEGAPALAIQPDGKIIALAGGAFALTRYNSSLPTVNFDPPSLRLGDSFTATFSGASLNDETYFDVRFRAPGNNTEQVALNWQRGRSATHNVPANTLLGTWAVTGVHPHQNPNEHTPAFVTVSTELVLAR